MKTKIALGRNSAIALVTVVSQFCFAALTYGGGAAEFPYDVESATLDASDDLTVEAWIQPAEGCPEGACLFDRWGPGSVEGARLVMGPGGVLRFITTSPDISETKAPLPTDKVSHVVAVFSPRGTLANLYVDGQLAASVPTAERRWVVPRTTIPLRIGADQEGQNRFVGKIGRVALYDRVVSAGEVAERFAGGGNSRGLVGEWRFASADGPVDSGGSGAELTRPVSIEPAPEAPSEALSLWYQRPAREWVEALPVGNGRLGAMVFGGVPEERIQLNEDTVWAGGPYNPANPGAREAYPKARELIFAGKQEAAMELIGESGMAVPLGQASYSTVGNLRLRFSDDAPVTGYQRSLDLDRAVATTRYEQGGVAYTREVFSSAEDQVIVVRLTADKAGKLDFAVGMDSPHRDAEVVADGAVMTLRGTSNGHADNPGQVRFESKTLVQSEGGQVSAEGDHLVVSGADAATLLVACGTNYVNWHDLSADPAGRASEGLQAAAGRGYDELLSRHLADYQALFRRVSIDLGPSADHLPTDERIRCFAEGDDPGLAELFFQFGRYLLIGSSRPGSQPANLQGIWNDSTSPPWGGKYTININTEMNYWPAEVANLTECAEPLFQMVREMAESGSRTAEIMYGAPGWVCHHNTDGWRATAPIDGPGWGMWPMGGAWLATHLWEHYLYTEDNEFLREAYPIFKGACEFFLATLVEHPEKGWLVTCPSMSPEHGGVVAGPAMDMQILRDLFAFTARSAELLGVDEEFRTQLLAARERLAPHQIGQYGQLQEWLADKDREFDSHRHPSHLYALFPSAQINPDTPELFGAAKKSLVGRGDAGTGWALAWKINLWARALDGDHAYKLLTTQLTPPKGGSQGGGTYPNLFDAHPPFQIDGNFGGVSGISELLMQSHRGAIDILPALPTAWPDGSVEGLRARGGFEVDIAWKDGRLEQVTIRSLLGKPIEMRYAGAAKRFNLTKDATATWNGQ